MVNAENGIELAPRSTTLGQLAERFFRSVRNDLSPATIGRYEEHWRMHVAPHLGTVRVASLKPDHLAELYSRLRCDKIRYVNKLGATTVP
jgi:hypothetical protein